MHRNTSSSTPAARQGWRGKNVDEGSAKELAIPPAPGAMTATGGSASIDENQMLHAGFSYFQATYRNAVGLKSTILMAILQTIAAKTCDGLLTIANRVLIDCTTLLPVFDGYTSRHVTGHIFINLSSLEQSRAAMFEVAGFGPRKRPTLLSSRSGANWACLSPSGLQSAKHSARWLD